VLDAPHLQRLLEPFGLELSPNQVSQTLAYVHLLIRWNEKINLTAIRDPEECVTRHFGESLFLFRHIHLTGCLLDIGSGAGFPGLALKIVFPDLSITLLEPVAKKRAFLKEVARVCEFTQVRVRPERLVELVPESPTFEHATMRAVGNLEVMVPLATKCLKPGGSLLLWLTQDQATALPSYAKQLVWQASIPIPLSRTSAVWTGLKSASGVESIGQIGVDAS